MEVYHLVKKLTRKFTKSLSSILVFSNSLNYLSFLPCLSSSAIYFSCKENNLKSFNLGLMMTEFYLQAV